MMTRRKKLRKMLNGRSLAEPPPASRSNVRLAFSYIEFLMVVVILAVIFLLVRPVTTDMDEMKLLAAADTLQADIYYLQQLARSAGPDEFYGLVIEEVETSVDAGEPEMWDALACAEGGFQVNSGLVILPQSNSALAQLIAGSVVTDGPEILGACCDGGVCTILSEESCINGGGSYSGSGTTCDPYPCVAGACCATDSSCLEVTGAECYSLSGAFVGGTCDPDPCDWGACCVESQCFSRPAAGCIAYGGTYLGDSVACDPDPCGLGACCTDDGSPEGACDLVSTADCIDAGGVYIGTGSKCDTDPTPCGPGACCDGGTCNVTSLPYCIAASDVYVGTGTLCVPNYTCGNGVCCIQGSCVDNLSPVACAGQSGEFMGGEKSCKAVICPSMAPPDQLAESPSNYPYVAAGPNTLASSSIPSPVQNGDNLEDILSGPHESRYALVMADTSGTDIVWTLVKEINLTAEFGVNVWESFVTSADPAVPLPHRGAFVDVEQFTLYTDSDHRLACKVGVFGDLFHNFDGGGSGSPVYPALPTSAVFGTLIGEIGPGFDMPLFLEARRQAMTAFIN